MRIPGKLAPYEKQVLELRSQGVTYSKIHQTITEQGYCGSVASLRVFVQKERQRRGIPYGEETNSDYMPTEFVQRHSITTLLYKKTNELYSVSQAQYEKVIEKYPMLAKLLGVVQGFYKMIYAKESDGLMQWLETVEELNIPELNTYANGIRRDRIAVTNGIELGYNNGLAEGSVNQIKVAKRIMYGRNSFDLLKAKVLLQEQYRFSFN
jgi:transposase